MYSIYHHIKLLRPLNVITSGMAVLMATAILAELDNHHTLSLTIIIVMLFTAASNSLNDALDHEIDLINRPHRPIPSNYVSIQGALSISLILFLVGASLCLQLPGLAIAVGIFLAIPLIIVYCASLKGRYLIGNITVSLVLGMTFLFVGASHGNVSPMVVPMCLAFGLTLLRELVKDVADIEGDQYLGLRTFPIVFGMNWAIRIIIILCVLIGLGSLIPYFIGVYGLGYIVSLSIGVELPLLIVIFIFLKNPSITSAIYSARILKFSTLMGLLSIYLGTI
tara:strand:+ start:719 stop:1558 length:840 start_codon:yes stop_codon:yes gene_type:complete